MDEEYLIKKWLADDLSAAEMESFKALEEYPMHIKMIQSVGHFRAPKAIEENGVANVYAKFNEQNSKERKTVVKGVAHWYKIAAIFIVALGVSLFFFTNTKTTIETLAAQKVTVALPDASEVVVNAGSLLTFAKNSWEDNREVHLKGEAFFKVRKGSTFDVITETGNVRVVGTQFSVKERDNYFEVRCFEGLVQVSYNQITENIPAGNAIKFINGTITFETTEANRPRWIDHISSFKSVPLYEVLQEFERQFNIEIETKTIDLQRTFTGGFTHDNLEDGIKSITLPLDLTYNIDSATHITLSHSKK